LLVTNNCDVVKKSGKSSERSYERSYLPRREYGNNRRHQSGEGDWKGGKHDKGKGHGKNKGNDWQSDWGHDRGDWKGHNDKGDWKGWKGDGWNKGKDKGKGKGKWGRSGSFERGSSHHDGDFEKMSAGYSTRHSQQTGADGYSTRNAQGSGSMQWPQIGGGKNNYGASGNQNMGGTLSESATQNLTGDEGQSKFKIPGGFLGANDKNNGGKSPKGKSPAPKKKERRKSRELKMDPPLPREKKKGNAAASTPESSSSSAPTGDSSQASTPPDGNTNNGYGKGKKGGKSDGKGKGGMISKGGTVEIDLGYGEMKMDSKVEEKFDFLRPKGAKNRIFRVNREMREKKRVYNLILDEF
jgi:hypothetical protein